MRIENKCEYSSIVCDFTSLFSLFLGKITFIFLVITGIPVLSSQLLQSVLQIAHQAGEHLQHFYNQPLNINVKQDNTPVTEADLFVCRFLTEKLTTLTPEIPILSEENCDIPLPERQEWRRYWLVDPLDGTQHFIDRSGHFAVMITLIENNRAVLGVIHAPVLNCTYYAMRGFGAYKQQANKTERLLPRRLDLTQPLKIVVGSEGQIEKVRLILNENFQYEFHIFGSCGLKSALVAEGKADCYIRLGETGEWDTAAGEILLNETQGVILDCTFQPLIYNLRSELNNPHFFMAADSQIDWQNILKFTP